MGYENRKPTMRERFATLTALLALFVPPARAQTPTLAGKVTWFGNSYNGKTAWTLQDVADICVLPDGTLFTNVFWDEGGANVQEYREGEVTAVAAHTHGWGYDGGAAVAANAKYLFIAQRVDNEGGGLKGDSWPAKGFRWNGISRRLRADIRKAAPFTGGRGGDGDTLRGAFLPITAVPEGVDSAIRGLCVDATRLYVSSPYDDSIKVYDTETMRLLRSWPVPRPDKICRDRNGSLWVSQRPSGSGDAWHILRFSAERTALSPGLTLDARVVPTSICVDIHGRLLIADAGVDNQIKIYADLDGVPRQIGTFGVRGGIFAPPAGTFGSLRFNKPVAIGADESGRIYVASDGQTGGGGTVLECYGSNSNLLWRRFGLLFVDCPGADPRHPEQVYTKEEHFTLDYARPPGQDWTYHGYTVNPNKYPDDPRLHIWSSNARVEILDGHSFLFVSDMTGDSLQVYRFAPGTDGETAIPCALFAKKRMDNEDGYPMGQPKSGEWIWTDANGDGKISAGEFQTGGEDSGGLMTLDSNGAVWQAWGNQIRMLPLRSLDARGVPHWDYAQARRFPKPADLDEIRRLRYLPDSDMLIVGGNHGADHNQHWKPMGPVLCVYDHWKSGKPALRKSVVLPYARGANGHESAEPISFDVAGDYVFVAYTRGLPAEGVANAFVKVLRASDLSVVGNLTAEAAFGETGLLDLVESTSVVLRPDGEYVAFLEDDAKAKCVVFRWKPVIASGAPVTVAKQRR